MKQDILDLYDDNFNKLNKTIIRRVDEIPECENIMQSYILIKKGEKSKANNIMIKLYHINVIIYIEV